MIDLTPSNPSALPTFAEVCEEWDIVLPEGFGKLLDMTWLEIWTLSETERWAN